MILNVTFYQNVLREHVILGSLFWIDHISVFQGKFYRHILVSSLSAFPSEECLMVNYCS